MLQFETCRPPSRPRTTRSALAPLLSRATLSWATVLVALSAAAPGPASAQGEAVKKPKLTVEESSYETGEVARDQVVEHTFKLRNSGDAPLEVQKIVLPPNTEILNRLTTLAPGEAGELRVRVPLLNDKAVALLKRIDVRTNDPESPSTILEMRILSTDYVTATPGYSRWISVQYERPGLITQHLQARDGTDFEVLRTTPPPAGITSAVAVAKQEAGKAREWKLDLTLAEDAPIGPILGTMLVYVNHPKQGIVPIPLSGFMRPMMAVTPNTLNVGDLKITAKESQSFTVKSFTTAPIHVTKVEHDLAGFPPATLETRTDGREYRIKLDFDPATMPKGALRGTLKITTDNAKVPVLNVPISGTIN